MGDVERALGVTRVARVTGLDRAGVEVACAVRPSGHVLQISNGKGLTWEQARRGAVSEAAELWAAERPPSLAIRAAPASAWTLGAAGRIAWCEAEDLASGASVYLPAHAVYCPASGLAPLGPASVRWTSNGMGAHPSARAAVEHGLLEAIERDQVARALPAGWSPRAIRDRKVAPPAALGAFCARLRSVRLQPHFFDLGAGLGVPVAGAILVDEEEGPLPVTAGYACAWTAAGALLGALLEAAQSRLTDVHGAREDVAPPDRAAAAALARACAAARPQRRSMPRVMPASAVRLLRRAGHDRVAVVTLSRAPLRVVKIVSPTLRLTELV